MKVAIFAEDAFGPQFFANLLKQLQNHRLVQQGTILSKANMYPKCNPKLGRMVKAALLSLDRAIIVVDAEGLDIATVTTNTMRHIRNNDSLTNTRIVVLQYEIEEWICASVGFSLRGRKPSEILKRRIEYEKYKLPQYVDTLDFEKLQKLKSFMDFLKALH